MRVFYSQSAGRNDIPCNSPIDKSLEEVLSSFRSLKLPKGFLGVVLDEQRCLQLLPQKSGCRIELLDSSIPAFDACAADFQFAENLIQAVALGEDCFQLARSANYRSERTAL